MTTYREVTDTMGGLVLYNNIIDIDPDLIIDTECEIFQYYLTNLDTNDVEYYKNKYKSLIFAYSYILNLHILCVDHFGTSWDSVEVDEN